MKLELKVRLIKASSTQLNAKATGNIQIRLESGTFLKDCIYMIILT